MQKIDIITVIPAYNAEKYLEETVLSILNQPTRLFGIVIVDDGSTDATAEICENLKDEYENVFVIHQENKGVPAARNAGIDFALSMLQEDKSGTYLTFLDADDSWEKGFLDKEVVGVLEKKYDLVGFQSCHCDNLISARSEPGALVEGSLTGGEHAVWCHSNQSFAAMFYRASLIGKFNIRFTEVKYVEDKLFSMECCYLAEQIYLMPKIMYLYRNNPLSIMHTKPHGINYFPVIIDAYLLLERKLSQYKNQGRGEFDQGKPMARWYIMDMIDEHFQHFGSRREITEFIQRKEFYQELLESGIGGAVYDERLRSMEEKAAVHRAKCWVRGCRTYLGRMALQIPVTKKMIYKKRYPFKV